MLAKIQVAVYPVNKRVQSGRSKSVNRFKIKSKRMESKVWETSNVIMRTASTFIGIQVFSHEEKLKHTVFQKQSQSTKTSCISNAISRPADGCAFWSFLCPALRMSLIPLLIGHYAHTR